MVSTHLSTRLATVLTMCSLACTSALAQSQAAATLTAAERDAALKAITSAFEEQYVFPEVRPRIVEKLQAAAGSGRYATDDPAVFAERVSDDLVEASNDKRTQAPSVSARVSQSGGARNCFRPLIGY